jgi:hypothetical protein
MTRKEIIALINNLEQKYPVDEWVIDDISVWPIIKVNIFNGWRVKYDKEFADYNAVVRSKTKRKGLLKKVQELLKSAIYLSKLLLKSPVRVPFLFLGANNYRVIVDDIFVNKYFEPIANLLRNEYSEKSLFIEYQPQDPAKKYQVADEVVFIENYYGVAKLLQYLNGNNKIVTSKLKDFNLLVTDLKVKMPDFADYNSQLSYLHRQIVSIKTYIYLFDIFFKKYAPKYAMGLCYYNIVSYAMDYSAIKNKVVSIDMQHGGQGDLHPSYATYNKVPRDGFNVFPKIFWCWDKPSYDVINNWITKQSFHQVLLGGNPWIPFSAQVDKNEYIFPQQKIILYTLQLNEPEDYIIDAIKNTPNGYVWWLRMHPRAINTKGLIEDLLKVNGVFDSVEIDRASSYPLPAILRHATVHLSNFSGSVIEAAQLGVKTILLNEVGVANYAEYINSGDAVACLSRSAGELMELIIKIDADADNRQSDNYDYKKTVKEMLTA